MNKLPDLNRWDKERLEKSIKGIGIRLPVVFDQNGRIIDGYHRKEIAEKLGIEYPSETIIVKDDEEFERLSVELNLARRHLSQEQLYNWYKVRKEIAKKIREEGGTQQEAAEAAGVTQQAVGLWESQDDDDSSSNTSSCNTGQPPDNRVKLDPALHEEIWQRKQNGETTVALGEEYGVSKQSISSICSQVTKQKNKEKKRLEREKLAEQAIKNDGEAEHIILGDFREINIPENSVDLILTDPPYGIDFKDTWEGLGKFANKVLKPSRFLISYFGQLNLIEFMNALDKHLKYYWTFCLNHTGQSQLINPRNVRCGWKPIVVFQKEPFSIIPETLDDVVVGSGREKSQHEWQQGLDELDIFVNHFSLENELIVDPFAGGGTTILAALKKNRRALGIEIDEKTYETAMGRINELS